MDTVLARTISQLALPTILIIIIWFFGNILSKIRGKNKNISFREANNIAQKNIPTKTVLIVLVLAIIITFIITALLQ